MLQLILLHQTLQHIAHHSPTTGRDGLFQDSIYVLAYIISLLQLY
jgi:hypothetical protein